MEMQISDLVSSIKKEGIEAANAEAERIIKEAEARAAEIVKAAREEADKAAQDAKREIDIQRQSASLAADQAKRDAMISFRAEVNEEYKRLLAADIKRSLDSQALGRLISAVVKDEDVSSLSVDVKAVDAALKAELATEIKKGLEIRVNKEVEAGFRVSDKDGSGYLDCTDEALSEILAPYFTKSGS